LESLWYKFENRITKCWRYCGTKCLKSSGENVTASNFWGRCGTKIFLDQLKKPKIAYYQYLQNCKFVIQKFGTGFTY